jgi:gliding motility-associated lipoprotein GldD
MRYFLVFVTLFLFSCQQDRQPLPKGYLRLNYPEPAYTSFSSAYPFAFEHNKFAALVEDQRGIKMVYPEMKATVYLNYKPIEKNLDVLLNDAYQLPYKHVVKATAIPEKLFVNPKARVFGTLFTVEGNAASQFQFFVTDSIRHFLMGSLYFYAQPNYDSLYPAIDYLQKDLTHLIESLQWD